MSSAGYLSSWCGCGGVLTSTFCVVYDGARTVFEAASLAYPRCLLSVSAKVPMSAPVLTWVVSDKLDISLILLALAATSLVNLDK